MRASSRSAGDGDAEGSAPVPPLLAPSAAFRALRREAGLSQRAMAERLGISTRTLVHYEGGEREPTHQVLERHASLVPLRDVPRLLGRPDRCAAWEWPGGWEALRDAIGHVVDEVVLDVHLDGSGRARETLAMTGVRMLNPALASPRQLTALLRAACLASPRRLRELAAPEDSGEIRFAEDAHEHVVAIRRDLACGLDYRREGILSAGPVPLRVQHDVLHPIERLRLRLSLGAPPPPGMTPRVSAWPSASGDQDERDVAGALHPHAVITSPAPGCLEAVIERPLLGFRIALGWVAEGPAAEERAPAFRSPASPLPASPLPASPLPASPPPRFRPPRGATLGARLRDLREAQGLSLREMARRLGDVSHGTVRNAEQGGDVSHETLLALLAAFPELSPHHLLPPLQPPSGISIDDLWVHARDAFGYCMDSMDKRGRVDEEGRMAMTLRMSHLRVLRGPRDGFELRNGGILGVFQAAPHAIEAITASPHETIVRGSVDSDGTTHQSFRFERHAGDRDLSLTIRHAAGADVQYRLTEARLAGELGPGPHHEGTSHWVRFPCERLRVSVDLPRGYRPRAIVGHVCPWRIAPDVDLPKASAAVPTPEPSVRERNGVLSVAITVSRPLVGFKYGLAWELA